MKKSIKHKKFKNQNNPFNTSPTTDPIKAFKAGILDGKEFIYRFIMDENNIFAKKLLLTEQQLNTNEYKDDIISWEYKLHSTSMKKVLKDIIKESIDELNELKNPNFDISKIHHIDAFSLGKYLGRKKAIEYAISKNFDADSIRNQWFIVADKIENDFD